MARTLEGEGLAFDVDGQNSRPTSLSTPTPRAPFADVVAMDGDKKIVEIHQVGKTLKDKITPVARERHAVTDIEKAQSVKVQFHKYD